VAWGLTVTDPVTRRTYSYCEGEFGGKLSRPTARTRCGGGSEEAAVVLVARGPLNRPRGSSVIPRILVIVSESRRNATPQRALNLVVRVRPPCLASVVPGRSGLRSICGRAFPMGGLRRGPHLLQARFQYGRCTRLTVYLAGPAFSPSGGGGGRPWRTAERKVFSSRHNLTVSPPRQWSLSRRPSRPLSGVLLVTSRGTGFSPCRRRRRG